MDAGECKDAPPGRHNTHERSGDVSDETDHRCPPPLAGGDPAGLRVEPGDVPLPALPAEAVAAHEHGEAARGRGETAVLPHGRLPALSAALDAYSAELMHAQYLVGVLAALGCDVTAEAAEVGGIARRGSELLTRRTHQ
jgi:hypothetical protein